MTTCWFCGNVTTIESEVIQGNVKYYVSCRECSCRGPVSDSRKGAEKRWYDNILRLMYKCRERGEMWMYNDMQDVDASKYDKLLDEEI